MRRPAIACLAGAALAMSLTGVADAAPSVTFKARAVPIAGFRHTGNILGAGAAVQAEYTIAGTEYGGFPPRLIGVTFHLPTGTKLHTQGFKTCSKATLEQFGPARCPRGSAAGPVGEVLGVVPFGSERVQERAELSSFYAPGGGIEFFTDGHSPVSLEILSSGRYLNLSGGAGFGPKLVAAVPLVSTVPGAPFASVERIKVKAGSAYRKHGKAVYYGRVPKRCPKGGFRMKTELTFAQNGEVTNPVTVTKAYRAPCPRH